MQLGKRKPKRITRPKEKRTKAQQSEAVPEPKPDKETKPEVQVTEQPKQQSEPAPAETKENSGLVAKLVAHNVSKVVAEELVKRFDHEVVEEWTKAINYADAKDRAAYLVTAIKEHWLVPEKYLGAKEREESTQRYEEQRQREREETERKMNEQKAEAERLDEIYNSLSPEQQEEVDKEAAEKVPSLVKMKIEQGQTDSPMVEGTLLVKKRDVVKEWIDAGKIKVDASEVSQ